MKINTCTWCKTLVGESPCDFCNPPAGQWHGAFTGRILYNGRGLMNVIYGAQKQLNQVFEIGSVQSYFIPGKTFQNFTMSASEIPWRYKDEDET